MTLTTLQYIILGIIQGITEWLPTSSSGISALIMANFFQINNIEEILKNTLILHLGTFLAAAIYLRKDIKKMFSKKPEQKNILKFLIISTIISGILGFAILQLLIHFENLLQITGKTITLGIGFLLLLTGIIQLRKKEIGIKKETDIKNEDGFFLGICQGLSALPGISRSGITTSVLLLKNFNYKSALKLSLLMSLPIVLAGNLLLNLNNLNFTSGAIYGIIASFIFGIATIHILIKTSEKINLGYFIIAFAILMIISIFVNH